MHGIPDQKGAPRLAYINGCAGSGKTTLLAAIFADYVSQGKKCLCSAFTGVAAGLLPFGMTTHRLFGLPTEVAFHTFPAQAPSMNFAQSDVAHYTPKGVPPTTLTLAESMPVALLRNMRPSVQLANGSILRIAHFEANTIICSILKGPLKGNTVEIPRIRFHYNLGTAQITRHQFPLVPAYGTTISRCQGQTLEQLILDLTSDIFLHGQLYVGLSRVRDAQHIIVVASDTRVTNVCYKELLLAANIIKPEDQ